MIVVALRYGLATTPFTPPTVPTFSAKTQSTMVNSDGQNQMTFRMFGPLNYNTNNKMTDTICAILTVVCAILIYILI